MAGSGRLTHEPVETAGSPRATINDVADAAGVSRQTVTRAMNDQPGIGAATKARVLSVAAQLGYRPSRFGRGLVSGGPHSLGLVVHDLTNPYYPELASAIVGLAARHSWNVLLVDLVHVAGAPERRRAQIAELAHQVDAVVGYLDRVDVDDLAALGSVPVVHIGDAPTELDVLAPGHGAVGLSMRLGIEQAIDHLLRAGVRRPVMLDRTATLHGSERVSSRRAELYRAGWRDRGVELAVIGSSTDDVIGGDQAMTRALAEQPELDAVCCYNDRTAFGALGALRRAGVDVPGTVRVVGLDGLSIGALVTPTLTTLALDMAEVARQAMELVLQLTGGDTQQSADTRRRFVAHQLLIRESA